MLARVDDPFEPLRDDHREPVAVDDLVVRTGLVREDERDAAVIRPQQAYPCLGVEPPGGALGRLEDLSGTFREPDHRGDATGLPWRAWDLGRIVRG